MSSKVLVIDGQDRGHFFLSIDGNRLVVGDSPTHAEALLKDLHIKRIRCELEVEEGTVVVCDPATVAMFPDQQLLPGNLVQLGHADLRLEELFEEAPVEEELVAPDAGPMMAPTPAAAPPAARSPAGAVGLPKQLRIVSGADLGKTFAVPQEGTVSVGKSQRHSEIVLHDLAVSRIHCDLQVNGDSILVSHVEGPEGTIVNGVRITEPIELKVGDTIRVGATSLQLEAVKAKVKEEEVPEVEIEEFEEVDAEEVEVEDAGAEDTGPAYSRADELLKMEGKELGHYRLGAVLGQGQEGVVYRAEDLKTKQTVALKLLGADFPASNGELQQFAQTLKLTNGLKHPNLVGLQGAGKSGGYCFLARDYVEGQSVAGLVKQCKQEGQFKWKRAGRIAVHLARVLVFLKQQKIVHGNITPANVLIREADKMTLLADTKLLDALAGSKLVELITPRKQAAEWPYMAPELLEPGRSGDFGSDLYAMGAVLYHLLTGEAPYSGKSPAQIKDAKLTKPSKLQPNIPSEFETVVGRLLAKNTADRFASAAEVLAEVEAIAKQYEIKL